MKSNDPRIVYVPLEEATAPRDGAVYMTNRWWSYVEDRGILFYRASPKDRHLSPQCSAQRAVSELVTKRLYPWATIKLIPVVYVNGSD